MIVTAVYINPQGDAKEVKNIVDDVEDDTVGDYVESFVARLLSRQLSQLTKIIILTHTEHIFIFDDENDYYYYVKERELMLRFVANAFDSAYSGENDLRDINKRLLELKK